MDSKHMQFSLKSGNLIPSIGFGTFQITGTALIQTVLDYAFAAGYRHIDTAAVYGNEKDIGRALKILYPKFNLTRADIFITSKLSPRDHGEKAYLALQESVKNLDCGYLDLYLIHWPGVQGLHSTHPDNIKLRTASWNALAVGIEKGLVKDLGVSNYTLSHLKELLSKSSIKPAVNQVEWHPFYHDPKLKSFCENEGILLQAYSSLGGSNNTKLLTDSTISDIANEYKKTTAQVLLKWALQQRIAIIPKARSKEHIEENINLNFQISEKHMNKLNNFNSEEKFAWDPQVII